jgi:AraC-like DNA-binding protein
MSDEPFRFVLDPIVTERNARLLIDVLVLFVGGTTSEELRRKFEQATGYKRQTYYEALRFLKYKRWIVGGGASKLFQLNPDGCWKLTKTSAGEKMEREQLAHVVDSQVQRIGELNDEVERLRDWSSGDDANGAGVALSSLVRIVGDSTASVRQRLKAAAAVLGYRVHDDSAAAFTKRFLQSICVDASIGIDYRVEAAELLRRHEAPRVTSETVRPSYDGDGAEADRIAAWRHDAKMQRRYEIAMATRDVPPPGWSDSDSFEVPPGWPPKIRLPSTS